MSLDERCSLIRGLTMRSVMLEIKDRFHIGRKLYNVFLSRDGFLWVD